MQIPDISRFNTEHIKARIVGGFVRDRVMGKDSKDVDIAIQTDLSFDETREALKSFGKLEGEVPSKFTLKIIIPDIDRKPLDFVICRKETDGKQWERGTFLDDMERRDFTCNAMAIEPDGTIIDIFNGRQDIEAGVLRCVGDDERSFSEDEDRFGRAFRFAAVNRWKLDDPILSAMSNKELMEQFANGNSDRRGEEFNKALEDDPINTMKLFASLPQMFQDAFFANGDNPPAHLKLHFSKPGKH